MSASRTSAGAPKEDLAVRHLAEAALGEAQIDLARKLTEAIWYMLTRNQPFAPAGATLRLAA